MSIQTNLKELRLKRGLTKKQLAELIGVHPKTYSNYEAGITLPRIKTIRQLAILFDISSDELLEI